MHEVIGLLSMLIADHEWDFLILNQERFPYILSFEKLQTSLALDNTQY